MAAVSYADIYEHSQLDDEQYKINLSEQIDDIVNVEPSAYSVHDMEHIVDCVNAMRDILTLDTGVFIRENTPPKLDYLICDVNYNNFLESEINDLVYWHDTMKIIIEN